MTNTNKQPLNNVVCGDAATPSPRVSEQHDEAVREALTVLKQDYSADCLQMASTREYVEDAVSQIIAAGYRRASPVAAPEAPASEQQADEEESAEDGWRRLALQFDGHRMQALHHLRAMLQDPAKHAPFTAEFLSAGPLSGEEVLAQRIAALASPAATTGSASGDTVCRNCGTNHFKHWGPPPENCLRCSKPLRAPAPSREAAPQAATAEIPAQWQQRLPLKFSDCTASEVDEAKDAEIADLRAALAKQSAEKGAAVGEAVRDGWTKKPPTEQGDYWHWTGDADHAPMTYHVMWSGSANKCFLSIGQYDIKEAIWCDKFGGWWKFIQQPAHPGDAPAGGKGQA